MFLIFFLIGCQAIYSSNLYFFLSFPTLIQRQANNQPNNQNNYGHGKNRHNSDNKLNRVRPTKETITPTANQPKFHKKNCVNATILAFIL